MRPVILRPGNTNPANARINITLELTKERQVALEIVNLLGDRVRMDQKGRMEPGQHEFSEDIHTLPPGIYFISVLANETRYSKKVVIQ